MKSFRTVIFWLHLIAGLIAGVAIAIMCFTGVVLAFEHELVEWAERDVRQVTVPADATRLSVAQLQDRVREARPEWRSAAVTLRADADAAAMFSAGRDDIVFVDPYTGDVRAPGSTRMQDFMHVMLVWHRFLGREGESRPVGKLINGICNLAFLALAVTGLYLWWPRTWSWRGVRAVALLNRGLVGKARDFNWHNAIGLWCAPVLIVLTLTAVPISFRWGGNLVYRLVGEEPPAQAGPPGSNTPPVEIVRPVGVAEPLDYDAVIASVQREFPRWEQIALRSGVAGRGARPATDGDTRAPGSQPLVATVREAGAWPRTATTTLTLNPFSGDTLRREEFADLSAGRRLRTWTRFLHTGQALGWCGQLVAGLASLGGLFLVYTGCALSWRRFFPRRPAAGRARVKAARARVSSS